MLPGREWVFRRSDTADGARREMLRAEARRVVGDGPAYLTFDIDSLDPSEAPGTGTPEAGGITAREALRLLRGLRGIDFNRRPCRVVDERHARGK